MTRKKSDSIESIIELLFKDTPNAAPGKTAGRDDREAQSPGSDETTAGSPASDEDLVNKIGEVSFAFGTVKVENGTVVVKGLPERDILPTLTPTPGVEVYVNGGRIAGKTEVSEHDRIEVVTQTTRVPARMELEYTDNHLLAFLTITMEKTIVHKLVDQPEQRDLVLMTETRETAGLPFSQREILIYLFSNGIRYGIDYAMIQQIIDHPMDRTYQVARGKAPTPPVNDHIVLLFAEQPLEKKDLDNEKIDFRDRVIIPSVDKDTLLAVRKPGTPGTAGISIFNKPVPPPPLRTIKLQAGKGTTLVNNGNSVVAVKPGLPKVMRSDAHWLFTIEDLLVHRSNIDVNTGHQFFKGSINIYGNVEDGMKVHAGGNLLVAGYCSRADIVAMENVWIKNIINSSVQAGVQSKYFKECQMTLSELKQQLSKLITATRQVQSQLDSKQVSAREEYMILLLIEKVFKDIPKLLERTVNYFKVIPVELPPFTEKLLALIKKNLPPTGLNEVIIRELVESINLTEQYFFIDVKKADISTEYVLQSKLICTGNINILGQGCFVSEIIAGGEVFISGTMRGGQVTADRKITLAEAGSKTGATTVLKTLTRGSITVTERTFQGTTFFIGGHKKTITENCAGQLKAFVRDNELVVRCSGGGLECKTC